MYLKQIELENFKSFGGKMTIPLMEGYMAVTGPNGSGKSNIADAILFVLGPKSSKAIRAGKLTDLIFDGGKTKNPADFTKVSLVFDNTDRILPWNDDIVRLTRLVRLAANREDYNSYFYINDQKSTMSEFDSLLSRARISADGYNLVQQGDVTRIVQMGALERRRIVDSISGIASYDADIGRANAEKAEAESNLERITIIMNELETQISQLKKDMEAAKLYMEAKSRLETANAQLLHRRMEDEKAKMAYTSESIESNLRDLEAMGAERDSLKERMDAIQEQIDSLDAEIASKVGPEYAEVKKRIEDARVAIANWSDRMERYSAENDEMSEELEELRAEAAEADKEIAEADEGLRSLADRRAAKEKALEEANAEERRIAQEMSSKGGEHRKLQDRLSELERGIDAGAEEEASLKASHAALELKKESLSREVASAEAEIDGAGFEIKDAEWSLSELKKESGATDVAAIQAKIMDAKRRESELEKQEDELRRAIARISGEYNRLMAEKKVTDRMRGSDAVAKILELRDKGELKGIHGTIAELASVDPKYELALSTAAGARMQAIVVDDDQVAADAMAVLKKTGAGRATFLPLNKMQDGKPRAKAIMVVKNTLGYAIDLIDFDPKYRAAFWYVFADTLVTGSLDEARRIMGSVRIVTLTGEVIEASGAMVGGAPVKAGGLKFGAASQSKLDEVGAEYRAANDSMDALQTLLRELREEIRGLDNAMRAASTGSVEVQGKIGRIEAQLKELRDKKKRLEDALAVSKKEYADNEALLQKSAAGLSARTSSLEALREERTKVRDRIEDIAPAELQERIQAARDAVFALTGELNALKDEAMALESERREASAARDSCAKEIAARESKMEANRAESEKLTAMVSEKEVELRANRTIEAQMEAGISDLRDRKDAAVKEKYGLDGDRKAIIEKMSTKEGFIDQLRANIVISQGVVDQLADEIAQVTVEVPLPPPSEDELKRTIRSCESTINRIGTVNLRAIDDYNERKQRYDSLAEDTGKLNAQIKELNKLTESLSAEKKGLFMKTYDGIDVNFREIYRQLSGGGEAYMKLEDEEDPFSGGLMINAKPKNGKLLRLEALSGGEKSLTALAFIFAIQEFQPSPFYVLDEVDMFLDSVNAEMVAKRVKESSAKAQFIQVSLRKVTLALADHLLGVTRQPNGMSKVIMQPDLAEVSKYEEQARKAAPEEAAEGA